MRAQGPQSTFFIVLPIPKRVPGTWQVLKNIHEGTQVIKSLQSAVKTTEDPRRQLVSPQCQELGQASGHPESSHLLQWQKKTKIKC